MGPAIAIWEVSLAFVLACLQMEREKFTTFQYISCMYFKNKHEDGITDEQDNVGRTMVEFSGGTTCVWAPVREKHLGPHKMMTYVGRSEGILRQKIFEFRVSEMAFHAFWEHFWVKSKDNKSLFFCSDPLFLRKYYL